MPLNNLIEVRDLASVESSIPEGAPLIMVNLLQFKPYAHYQDESPSTQSGHDVYMQKYVPAFSSIAASLYGPDNGIQPIFLGQFHASLVDKAGEDETWDLVVLVKYPNLSTFRGVVESDEYAAQAHPHRLASLKKWELFATTAVTL